LEADGELVRQTMAGRTAAYAELVRRWSARVLAVCHSRVRSAAAAEDLAQETLLRGFRGIKTLAEPDRFGSWLCGIAVRTCLDWLKSSQRTEVSYDAMPEKPDVVASAIGDEREETQRLMAEVQRLPEAYREVIMLYYYQDGTYEDLAKMLGVSAATINARLTKARAMLRERMGVATREAR
jgi:RNA polymerase sigma factor (sigma-70 family)